MITKIDSESWERREVFRFFSAYANPFTGLTANVDFTEVYRQSKSTGRSFYLSCVHHILKTANSIENFRLRIVDGEVWRYDTVDAYATLMRDDHSLAFVYFPWNEELDTFIREARKEEQEARESTGLHLTKTPAEALGSIFFTCIPWVSYTELFEPDFGPGSSEPHISFGKFYRQDDRILMPVTAKLHHGLGDGYHVSQLFTRLEQTQRLTER